LLISLGIFAQPAEAPGVTAGAAPVKAVVTASEVNKRRRLSIGDFSNGKCRKAALGVSFG
jgi:hypothetical protein